MFSIFSRTIYLLLRRSTWHFVSYLFVCTFILIITLLHNDVFAQGERERLPLDTPKNVSAGLTGKRASWLLAAVPPTRQEILADPALFFEGNWKIEWSNHPEFKTAEIHIIKGIMHETECTVSGIYGFCRDPQAQLITLSGGAVTTGDKRVNHSFTVKVTPNIGSLAEIEHYGARGGPIKTKFRRNNDDASVIFGTWSNSDNQSGLETWRREPRPRIEKVTCKYETGSYVQFNGPCQINVLEYPKRGAMRGNLPTMVFEIFGSSMHGAGPLPMYIDWEKSKLEIADFCYLYERPFNIGEKHGCASFSDTFSYGRIIGVRVIVNVFYGALPGIKTMWIGGQPVSFDLHLPELPVELRPNPNIKSISFVGDHDETLTSVSKGDRFRIKVVKTSSPTNNIDKDWVNLEFSTPDSDETQILRIEVIETGEKTNVFKSKKIIP
jgi:hypothetical protein